MPESPIQQIVCLMGLPVAGNPTQFMMERSFAAAGLDWRYITLEVSPEHLAEALQGFRAMGFRGGNFTIPHKVAVIPHLDALGESASLMGAVNCVVRRGDKLIGENTDGKGFVTALQALTDPAGQRIVLFGAGGAARAIAVELILAGAKHITVVNRAAARGEELEKLLNAKWQECCRFQVWREDFIVPDATDVVINATSVGLYPDVDARLAVNVEPFRFSTFRLIEQP